MTLVYPIHGFSPQETTAIAARLAGQVTPVFVSEQPLRASQAGRSVPVASMFADADQYAAAVGLPGLADQLRSGIVLAASEAELRQLAVGGTVRFADGRTAPVSAIVDDHVLGGYEIASAADVLRPAATLKAAYLLVTGGLRTDAIRAALAVAVPTRSVRVKTTTANGYFSSRDTVLTQLQVKKLFGEFAVRQLSGGAVAPDTAWEQAHIVRRRIVQLGEVACNKAVLDDLEAAMKEVTRRNLGATVHTADFQYQGGCYNPRVARFADGGALSAHTWGIAVDINVDRNDLGAKPHQDPRLVAIMAAHNFTWGGRWLRPDGAHFEWVGPTVRH